MQPTDDGTTGTKLTNSLCAHQILTSRDARWDSESCVAAVVEEPVGTPLAWAGCQAVLPDLRRNGSDACIRIAILDGTDLEPLEAGHVALGGGWDGSPGIAC